MTRRPITRSNRRPRCRRARRRVRPTSPGARSPDTPSRSEGTTDEPPHQTAPQRALHAWAGTPMSTAVLAAGPLMHGDVPLGEAVSFWILGPIALAGGIGMVLFRNAVPSALALAATMMCLGVMYIIEQGPFIGLVQIIVYTGAIMILFLFVLMLVGRDSSDSLIETLRGQRWAAGIAGIGFALLVAVSIGRAFTDIKPTN